MLVAPADTFINYSSFNFYIAFKGGFFLVNEIDNKWKLSEKTKHVVLNRMSLQSWLDNYYKRLVLLNNHASDILKLDAMSKYGKKAREYYLLNDKEQFNQLLDLEKEYIKSRMDRLVELSKKLENEVMREPEMIKFLQN